MADTTLGRSSPRQKAREARVMLGQETVFMATNNIGGAESSEEWDWNSDFWREVREQLDIAAHIQNLRYI
jgi:hypothetical protein